MSKIALIAFLTFYSALAFSKFSHLSCSKNSTLLMFINGVDVKDNLDFLNQSSKLISELDLHNTDANNLISSVVKHNRSEGYLSDIAETFFLFMRQNSVAYDGETAPEVKKKQLRIWMLATMSTKARLKYACDKEFPELKIYCDEMKRITLLGQNSITFQDLGEFRTEVTKALYENKKVILVTHSAGAMFADRIRDYVSAYHPSKKSFLGHVAIARPLKSNHSTNNFFVNFKQDSTLNELISYGLGSTPKPNVDLHENCPLQVPFPADYPNHFFSCYTGPGLITGPHFLPSLKWDAPPTQNTAVSYVADTVYRVASLLGNNDEKCCNKAPGKIWRNDAYCESDPELCQTSFIADTTKLEVNDASFIHDSQICGDYTIKSFNPISFKNTKMYGSGTIISEAGDGVQFNTTTLHRNSILETTVKSLNFFNTEFNGTSRLYGNTITFIDSKIKGFNRFESTGITSISLRNTQLNSESLELNKIETPIPLSGGHSSMNISDSTLTGRFNLAFNGLVSRSILGGNIELDGSAMIIDSTSSGSLKMNTDGGGNSSPSFQYAINQGNLTITNSVQASNATFHGTNTFYVPPTTNSTVQSFINNADVQDTSLSGFYNVTSGSRRWIKNLVIDNDSHPILNFDVNSWDGTLTLNGSMTVSSSSFGRDVTINALTPGTGPNEYRLGILRSTFSDELVVSERGGHVDCNFTGSGSSYTRTCLSGSNHMKVNPLFAIDQQAEQANIKRLIRIEKEKGDKRIAELKAIHEIKLK